MSIVISINYRLKNNGKAEIHLDNNKNYFIDEETIAKLDIHTGKEISEAVIEEIILNDEINRGKKYTLFILSRKDYSKYNIIQKLHTRDLSENSISKIIEWLEENNFINDESFAYSWARYRISNKPVGKFRLNQELKTKGIGKDIRQKVINEIFTGVSESDLARKLVGEKISIQKIINPTFTPKKIYNFLIRRGFSTEIARNIFFELVNKEFKNKM
ncbi:MAG: regulatory protein RecX [Candidatus Atribacteria bacterium]|nr:regulatory protein RecX [Candidatus Atribacteria bacterium]